VSNTLDDASYDVSSATILANGPNATKSDASTKDSCTHALV